MRVFFSGNNKPQSRVQSLRILSYLPMVMIVAGAAILFYVASQYWTMYSEQRRLAEEWNQQQQSPAGQAKAVSDGLTHLSIPKINLNAVIVEGTNHRALLIGPGHIKSTPTPGALGNSVITGHRDTFFRHIYELSKGDIVTVQRNGQSFEYEVTGKRVVQPTDVSVLDPTSDSRLTLITCYPTYYIGPAPERLVVSAKLTSHNQAVAEQTASPARTSAASGGSRPSTIQ